MNKFTAKIIVWHVLVLLLAFWMWGFKTSVSFNPITGLDFNLPAVGAFVLLISVLTMGYLLFRQRRWAISSATIVGLLFLLAFGFTWINIVGLGLFILFAILSNYRIRRDARERMKLNIIHTLEVGLLSLVVGFFILISFAAYQSPFAVQIKEANSLPRQTQVLFKQITEKMFGSEVQGQTPAQRQRIFNEIADQTFKEFNTFLKPYFRYAPPALAFGLFLILWGLSFVFAWLGVAVGLFLFWILKKTKMVRIETKEVKAEVLVV